MGRIRWDHPNAFDHVLLLAAADGKHRSSVKERVSRVPGRQRAADLGHYPRFKIVAASSGVDAVRRASAATVVAVDLAVPKGPGLETIRQIREAHPRLAILAFGSGADTSDAIAAVMAGADFFHDCRDESCAGFEHGLELAIDRRLLTHTIEKSEAEVEAARGRLEQLSEELVRAVPGFRPLASRQDVIPFREAARRYLLAATQLFAGDPRGLAKALGVSYFALRRLLARYDVPFPAVRSRR